MHCCWGNAEAFTNNRAFETNEANKVDQQVFQEKKMLIFKGSMEFCNFSKICMAKTNSFFLRFFFYYFFCTYLENLFIQLDYEGVTKKAKWAHPSLSKKKIINSNV